LTRRPELDEFVARVRGLPYQEDLDAATVEVFDAFESIGVEALLLKGPALAEALYVVAGKHRGYSDIDLLVAWQDLPPARSALADLGYANSDRFWTDYVAGVLHAETWERRGERLKCERLLIDLHWRLAGCEAPAPLVWGALAPRRASIEVAGRRVGVLDRVGLAMHLATHAAQHGPDDLKALADLSRGLERWPFEVWSSAASLAAALDGTAAFAAGLRLLPSGAKWADELELPSTEELDWAIRNLDAQPRGTFHLQALARARGARGRLGVLRRSLFPPRKWIANQYRWVAGSRTRLVAAYGAHLLRTPTWAARAWRYRRRQRRAGR
jgi:Uncharacterised nucleotidyltransferase